MLQFLEKSQMPNKLIKDSILRSLLEELLTSRFFLESFPVQNRKTVVCSLQLLPGSRLGLIWDQCFPYQVTYLV